MPDYLKPLFNRHLLADALRELPPAPDDAQRAIARNWATSAARGGLPGQKEKPLQGQFLSEVLDRLLGYRQPVGADDAHYMEPETSSTTVKGYRPPDARLGWFGATQDITRAVVELKAPGADLDARQGGSYGKLTPVEQAFGYAAKVDGCRWVIVSNFLEIRLYRTDRGQGYGQRFQLAELAEPERLATFLFLLSRPTLLGTDPALDSPVERLARRTDSPRSRSPRRSMCSIARSAWTCSPNCAATIRRPLTPQRRPTPRACWSRCRNCSTAACSSAAALISACCRPRC